MPDEAGRDRPPVEWKRYVRDRLPEVDIPPQRRLDIVEELAAQLDATYDKARQRGDSHDAAMAAAAAEVPDWHELAATVGRIERRRTIPPPGIRSGGLMTGLTQDVRHAARSLARAPGFLAVALATLIIGLGAGAAAWSIVDAVLMRPLPFADPDRLMLVRATVPPEGRETAEITWLDAGDLARETAAFASIGLVLPYAATTTSLDPPERVEGFSISTNLFGLLGVQPMLGRGFTAAEEQPGQDRVVLLGYGLWQRLGGSRDVVGQTLTLDEVPRTIVGVLPQGFSVAVLRNNGDVYVPSTRADFAASTRALRAYRVIARLADGVSMEQAGAVAATVGARLAAAYPDTNQGRTFTLMPLRDAVVGDVRAALWLVLGLVALILLIAGVNLANLVLARAVSRALEMAVRCALGASAWRLARESIVEAALLGAAGIAGGFLIARWLVAIVRATPGLALPRLAEIGVDGGVLAALAAAGGIATVAIGLTPVALTRRLQATVALRTGHETAGRRAGTVRAMLVVGQTAVAFMLLAAAALLTMSLQNLLALPAGFDSGVSTMRVSAPAARYVDRDATVRFYRDLIDALRARPGIEQAGFVSILPLAGNTGSTMTVQGREDVPMTSRPDVGWQWASPGYFDAIGIRVVRGRDLSFDDLSRSTHVTVINETLARLHFPNEDPIGHRVYFGPIPATGVPEWHEIVGVVSDVRHRSLEREPDARAYDLFGQHWGRTISLAVRSNEPPLAVAGMVRALLAERDPRLAVFAVQSSGDLISSALAARRLLLWLVATFAAIGLAVALLGVYGVVAVMVMERRREMGVRVALGASAGVIRRLVIGHGLRLVAIGLAIGLAGAFALRRFIEAQLYGLTATDVPSLALAGLALMAAAAVPCLLLSNRAAAVDPATALRES